MESKNRVESVGNSWSAGVLLFGLPAVVGVISTQQFAETMLPFLIGVKAALTDEEFAQFLGEFEEARVLAELGGLL